MPTARKSKRNHASSYLLRLEPSTSGEHVLLTDLKSGQQLEFDSLEAAQTHLTSLKPKSGLR
jgi:hypothetical protein